MSSSKPKGVIHYPWDNEPTSRTSSGHRRATWGFNDCVKLSWESAPDSPFQWMHLECNEGEKGTNPPWDRVWQNNSTEPSGNGSAVFCLANSNPTPPLGNTCRFVLELGPKPDASTTFTAFSPDVSLDVGNKKKSGATPITYPVESTSTTSSSIAKSTSTPVATSAAAGAQSSASTTDNSSSGLSTGAKAGIGAGVGVAALILIALLAFFFLKKRRGAKTQRAELSTATPHGELPATPYYSPVNTSDKQYYEAPTENKDYYGAEKSYNNGHQGRPMSPQELGSGQANSVSELPGHH